MRILVSAANLHVGGGVAVASSVIDEFSRMTESGNITVLASSEVDANLQSLGTDRKSFADYFVIDLKGPRAALARLPVNPRSFDRVLVIFGPSYSIPLGHKATVGFAQPWIAFPHNAAAQALPWGKRQWIRMRFRLMSLAFLPARELVVEQTAVREGLQTSRILRRKNVDVVSNVTDSVFQSPERWEALDLPRTDGTFRFGLVSRNYPHKNLAILPKVKEVLERDHGVPSEFFVTLSESEWMASSRDFRRNVTNVGPLRLTQSPSFCLDLDAVVFPTLLECFSATPLEAQILDVPLFASDLPVIRATVGDYATYFNPLDPADIAQKIAAAIRGGQIPRQHRTRPNDQAESYTASDRAAALLRICLGPVNDHRSVTSESGERAR